MLANYSQARDGHEVETEELPSAEDTALNLNIYPMSTRFYNRDSSQIFENSVEEIKDSDI